MEKNIMEEFEKDMALYRKYEETIRCIGALMSYSASVINKTDYTRDIFDYFMEKVITNLEDERISINIDYKGDYRRLIGRLNNYSITLYDKYKKNVDTELLSELSRNVRFSSITDYDLVRATNECCTTNDWDKEMLYSNMPLKMRKEIFLDTVGRAGKYAPKRAMNLLNPEGSGDGYPKKLSGEENKRNNLKLLLASMDMDGVFKSEVMNQLGSDTVFALQREKIIDFTYHFAIYDAIYICDGFNINSYGLIEPIFSKVYNNLTSEEKTRLIIHMINMIDPTDLGSTIFKLMRLDFKFNQEIIDAMANLTVKAFENYAPDWYTYIQPIEIRELVAYKLLRKATNKKEYKKYLEYYRDFLEKTDVDKKLIEQEEKENQLQTKRQEFTSLIYNLNDKLQETTPGKRLLKEIDFKKLS